MRPSQHGQWIGVIWRNSPVALLGAVGVLVLMMAGLMWTPGLIEAQDDPVYVWAFDDFGRIVVHWDHEAASALAGGEIANYTVRWRQQGTLAWNTIVQEPPDPNDPDVLIAADLLTLGATYEIVMYMEMAGDTPSAVHLTNPSLVVEVSPWVQRQSADSSDDVLYYTNNEHR